MKIVKCTVSELSPSLNVFKMLPSEGRGEYAHFRKQQNKIVCLYRSPTLEIVGQRAERRCCLVEVTGLRDYHKLAVVIRECADYIKVWSVQNNITNQYLRDNADDISQDLERRIYDSVNSFCAFSEAKAVVQTNGKLWFVDDYIVNAIDLVGLALKASQKGFVSVLMEGTEENTVADLLQHSEVVVSKLNLTYDENKISKIIHLLSGRLKEEAVSSRELMYPVFSRNTDNYANETLHHTNECQANALKAGVGIGERSVQVLDNSNDAFATAGDVSQFVSDMLVLGFTIDLDFDQLFLSDLELVRDIVCNIDKMKDISLLSYEYSSEKKSLRFKINNAEVVIGDKLSLSNIGSSTSLGPKRILSFFSLYEKLHSTKLNRLSIKNSVKI